MGAEAAGTAIAGIWLFVVVSVILWRVALKHVWRFLVWRSERKHQLRLAKVVGGIWER